MFDRIFYYALPSQPAKDKFPQIGTVGTAFQIKRWLKANRERGYMGIGNCNHMSEHFFWHYPCEFALNSRGWPIGPDANIHFK